MDVILPSPILKQGKPSDHHRKNIPAAWRPLSVIQHNLILSRVNSHQSLHPSKFIFPPSLQDPPRTPLKCNLRINRPGSGFEMVPGESVVLDPNSLQQGKYDRQAEPVRFGSLELAATKLSEAEAGDCGNKENCTSLVRIASGLIKSDPGLLGSSSRMINGGGSQHIGPSQDNNAREFFKGSESPTVRAFETTHVCNSETAVKEHLEGAASSPKPLMDGYDLETKLQVEQVPADCPEDMLFIEDNAYREPNPQRASFRTPDLTEFQRRTQIIRRRVTFLDEVSEMHYDTTKPCRSSKTVFTNHHPGHRESVYQKFAQTSRQYISNEPLSSSLFWADDECTQSHEPSLSIPWSPWASQNPLLSPNLHVPRAESVKMSQSHLNTSLPAPREPSLKSMVSPCISSPSHALTNEETFNTNSFSPLHQLPSQTLSTTTQPLYRSPSFNRSKRPIPSSLHKPNPRAIPSEIPETQRDDDSPRSRSPSPQPLRMQLETLPWPVVQSLFGDVSSERRLKG